MNRGRGEWTRGLELSRIREDAGWKQIKGHTSAAHVAAQYQQIFANRQHRSPVLQASQLASRQVELASNCLQDAYAVCPPREDRPYIPPEEAMLHLHEHVLIRNSGQPKEAE
jgi:hypothetical protein